MQNNMNWDYKYQLALEVLRNKIEKLYLEYSINSENNPIEHTKYRIKDSYSIKDKIVKKIKNKSNILLKCDDIVLDDKIIDKYLSDVVGVRIVCSFKSDLKSIINIIKEDSDLIVIDEKDYIDNPKSNRYKSYHMIVLVPVVINGEIVKVKAEIQLRTIAMDMYASQEHIISYKKDIDLSSETIEELVRSSEICDQIDTELDNYIKEVKELKLFSEPIDLDSIPDKDFDKIIPKYEKALKIIEDKILAIKKEYKFNNVASPIEHINKRIKSKKRVIWKMMRRDIPININNMEEYISDIAAIRVVCPFKKDVYGVIDKICNDNDLIILEKRDYIDNPKSSGYRSYHLKVLVPINTDIGIIYVKVEIQVRSMAMDMWASLERKLCYQKDANVSIRENLKKYSYMLSYIDNSMDLISEEAKVLINNKSNGLVRGKRITNK